MSDPSNSLGNSGITPRDALTACRREYGLESEGQWIYDVRAGYLQLTQITPQRILTVTETGSLILIGTAVDLYEMCQSGSAYLIRPSAIGDAQSIVISLARQRLDTLTQQHDLDDEWSPTDNAATVGDAKAALHFYEQTVERDWSIQDFLSTDFRHGP